MEKLEELYEVEEEFYDEFMEEFDEELYEDFYEIKEDGQLRFILEEEE